MKAIRVLFATLVAICAWSCSSDLDETLTVGSISGTVSDKTTGEPVATVNIALSPGGMSTVTGTDGSYTFDNLEGGNYELAISKEGYQSVSYPVYVSEGAPTPAHLLIERIPGIVTADREQLDFGENTSNNTMSFNIVNRTYEDLEWTIEERCDWIVEVKPDKGTLKYGKTEGIIVVIDRDKLESGENKSSIVIRSSNGSSQLTVTAIGADRSVPRLNTLAATDVKAQSATINGEIVNAGTPAYTERGFVYSLTPMPTVENTIKKITCPVNDNTKYSYTLNDLEINQTYYVRAYAINSTGTAYSSNEVSFTPNPTLPAVTTHEVYNLDIANGTVTFRGEVTEVGEPAYTERGFVYSEMPAPTINNDKIIANGAGIKGSFTYTLNSLKINRTYYVRAYATNSAGTAYSSNAVSFTTRPILPVVKTLKIYNPNISNGTATFRGEVVSAGEPVYTERGFVYSEMPAPTINDDKIIANGSGLVGSFSKSASNLPRNGYYVRAYATNAGGTSYGEEEHIAPEWIALTAAGIAVQCKDLGTGDHATAVSMCENSIVGGYTDWRLPTKDELMILYNNRELIGGFSKNNYWASDYGSDYYYDYRYCVNFANGRLDKGYKTNDFCVRAIRTLK